MRITLLLITSSFLISCAQAPVALPPKTELPSQKITTKKVTTPSLRTNDTVNAHYGRYSGNIQSEWITNGQMKLLSDFRYKDPQNVEWVAPKGAVINGASIPSVFWGTIGGPFTGKYFAASVIHDVACVERKRPWPMVHRAFYQAMRASGVSSLRAKLMYAAVHYFGPRWDSAGKTLRNASTNGALSKDRFKALQAAIEASEASNKSMTLRDIRKFK